jgi:hypothetical protein
METVIVYCEVGTRVINICVTEISCFRRLAHFVSFVLAVDKYYCHQGDE